MGLTTHHTISMHDCQIGAVNKLAITFDGKFLFSAGLDGNVFSYEVVAPKDVEMKELNEIEIDLQAAGEDVKGMVIICIYII